MHLGTLDYDLLYEPARLPELDQAFATWLLQHKPALNERLQAYRGHAALTPPEESVLLIALARELEVWLARTLQIEDAVAAAQVPVHAERSIHALQEEFVRPRAKRPGARPPGVFADLHRQVLEHAGDTSDPELAIAQWWQRLKERPPGPEIALLEDWLAAALRTPEGRATTASWVALRVPARYQPFALVTTVSVAEGHACESPGPFRERDGFDLTDSGSAGRSVMAEVHYCVYCHDRESDFCSQGFRDRVSGAPKNNALNVALTGCPLRERISEAHLLMRDGCAIGALAVIMIENPLLAATGHRICNDCTKSCIYQKQDPVRIPEVETHILDRVLALPYGFELYFLLTRWNPLNRERPYGLPYQGRKVLVVGAGPAGFTLTHHLLQAGFGVVLVDGLKLEPLPSLWTGSAGTPPEPVRDVQALYEPLDTRVPRGFGGVAEYGITVRWNKNYLTLIHVLLARHVHCIMVGGVRFGGTLTLEDAWNFGFDHVALAMGAGKPAVLTVPEGLAQGVRAASDFLMALQLTGAARADGLANLQVRLPAVVIGGGLTAIDAATELQAYYLRQVEQFERRARELEAQGTVPAWEPFEADVAAEYRAHGCAVIAERERAARTGEAPALRALIRAFGGVTVAYRRSMQESPAYTRNHEEIAKALEEGLYYAEHVTPTAVRVDAHKRACAVRFRVRPAAGTDAAVDGLQEVELPARTVLVAAGSVPNTVYAREHPGSFVMDGHWFAPYRRVATADGSVRLERAALTDAENAFYTSHEHQGRWVSFHGDMHPAYHGSVVKAMASGTLGARAVIAQFAGRTQVTPSAQWRRFATQFAQELRPVVCRVETLGPRLTRLEVRAPQAARNWRPGQVYRLQNYAQQAARLAGIALQMEGVALDATAVDRDRGTITLLMSTVGASTAIAARLLPGEPVVLMGPGSAAAPMPLGQTVGVMGGHSAATSLLDSALEWRGRGNQVVFIGHFARWEQVEPLAPAIEAIADRVHWIVEEDAAPGVRALGAFLDGMGTTPQAARWLQDLDYLLVADDAGSMKCIADALYPALGVWLKPGLQALAAVNSPMQCMMKEVCAQCLCRHRTRESAEERVVFSCFNHHQPLFSLDCDNLRGRQIQNSVQEKLSQAWLQHLLQAAGPAAELARDPRTAA